MSLVMVFDRSGAILKAKMPRGGSSSDWLEVITYDSLMWRGVCFLLLSMFSMAAPVATPAVSGPYHVEGRRILDAEGHEYLIRGTELPVATLKKSDIEGDA